jgi:hypothetical protein
VPTYGQEVAARSPRYGQESVARMDHSKRDLSHLIESFR